MDERYVERRRDLDRVFERAKPIEQEPQYVDSPSGRYRLAVTTYSTGPKSWNVCRGIVTEVASGDVIADVKRNIGGFSNTWVEHPNGNEYLLCGEDYQGYSTINLTKRQVHVYFPEAGYTGGGFCWSQPMPSPDKLMLAVEGCFWAAPYDLVFYDFREPDSLPYRELKRVEDSMEVKGWADNDTFVMTQEFEVRKADGVRYDTLDRAEQERLNTDSSLVDYIYPEIQVPRPPA